MPLSPEWAKLPKRHCDDCGKFYKPVKPSRPGECGFCSPNCRKSYHKHGGAYRKLRVELEKLVAKRMGELEKRFREIVRWEIATAMKAGHDLEMVRSLELPVIVAMLTADAEGKYTRMSRRTS